MKMIQIDRDFSPDPNGRYYSDGPNSGEKFRQELLLPALDRLKNNDVLTIKIDGDVIGYGSSFLDEGFAGVVFYGFYKAEVLKKKIEIIFDTDSFDFYKSRIFQYIDEAEFNSEPYLPSKR